MEIPLYPPVCTDRVILLSGEVFKLSLWPETYMEEDGEDFTGNYNGTLTGTDGRKVKFDANLIYDERNPKVELWELEPVETDPSLIPIIDELIKDYRKDDF